MPSFWAAKRRLEATGLSQLRPVILWGHKTYINKIFWYLSHPHGCFHMGKRAGLSHKCWNFYRENISLVQNCQEEPDHPQISPTATSWTSHTTPIAILRTLSPRKQPETLSNLKNIPSSPHFLTIPSSLALYSIIWPPKKKATFIFSQATKKSLTQCFVWQPNQNFHRDGLKGELKAQTWAANGEACFGSQQGS